MGFPCNQFGGQVIKKTFEKGLHIYNLYVNLTNTFSFCSIQEPGTDADIKEFAKGYNAEFDLFSKIEVNGDKAHPLWNWMKAQPKGKGTLGK